MVILIYDMTVLFRSTTIKQHIFFHNNHLDSERILLKEKNESFRLENESDLTIFAKFSCENFHTKTHVSNLMHFQGEIDHFFL